MTSVEENERELAETLVSEKLKFIFFIKRLGNQPEHHKKQTFAEEYGRFIKINPAIEQPDENISYFCNV